MTDDKEPELPEFLSDPMSVLFDLNDEMLEGIDKMRYALGFSFWAGGLIAIGSLIYAAWLVLVEQYDDAWWHAILLLLVAWVSAYAAYSAHAERPFMEDYSILGQGIKRANSWKPDPKVPDGPDPISRLLTYLKESDERIGYIAEKTPDKMQRGVSVSGKSKQEHRFDLLLKADKPFGLVSDPIPEGMILLVRAVAKANLEDVKGLRDDAEDVLKKLYPFDQSARVILLQTSDGTFSEKAAEYANKNWMKYKRAFGDSDRSWSSPVELIGESPNNTYHFENMYFG